MKSNLKCLVYLSVLFLFLIIYKSVKINDQNDILVSVFRNTSNYSKLPVESEIDMKYILQWTSPKNVPFVYMGVGSNVFLNRNCTYTNCYVTSNRNFLIDYSNFDVIVFAGPEIVYFFEDMLPARRSPHQKYVYASIESAAYYPVCTNQFNRYFNWTWSYKLDSDLRWGYIVVKDAKGRIVGPNKDMHWIKREDMQPVPHKLKEVLRGKSKAAAWFVSNCHSLNEREIFASKLSKILLSKYNLTLDIYGSCGPLQCSRKNERSCDEIIRKDYFFYLSFENAFSEDYVTEKLLHAVQYNAIPIVLGGANYSRFLPEGSYLNARELGVEKLTAKINELIKHFNQYVEYFRWTNHYSYHKKGDSIETDDYCQMCALLNDENKVKKVSIYHDFTKWWNPTDAHCYDNFIDAALI